MQRQIKFTASGASSAFGAFAPGDVVRCDASLAKHFVEEAHAARYLDAAPVNKVAEPARKPARKTKPDA